MTFILIIIILYWIYIYKKLSFEYFTTTELPYNIWLYWEKRDSQMVIDLSYSILLMVIPSFTFFIILPLALKFNNSFTLSMILATISTIVAYWIFTLMLNKIGIHF